MNTYNDKELETTFVQARLDAGMTFDDAWAAWVDFHARIQFMASQPFLPLYNGDGSDCLTREERVRMRREARRSLGKDVRTDDVLELATAAYFLGVRAPWRQPLLSRELEDLSRELCSRLDSKSDAKSESSTPNLDAFATRFRLACPDTTAARAAEAAPEKLAFMFLTYIRNHELGNLPFQSQARMFARMLDDYVEKYREAPHTAPDFCKFLEARGEIE